MLLDGMPDPTADRSVTKRRCRDDSPLRGRTDGHAFVLFTSYEMMRRVAAELTAWLAERRSGAVLARPTACRGAR